MLRLQNASLQKLQWYYYQLIRISLVQIDILRDLVPFVQFKKREKHPWRSVTFSKVAVKSNTPPWVFFTFFRLYKWYQIVQRIILCQIFKLLTKVILLITINYLVSPKLEFYQH